jgi:hypothetical protein
MNRIVGFLDSTETWLFNVFRRIVVAFALLALVVAAVQAFSGTINIFDGPDVRASESIEKPDWDEYAAAQKKKKEVELKNQSQQDQKSKEPAVKSVDKRVTKVTELYNSVLKKKIDAERLDRWVGERRRDEFLDGLVDWSSDVAKSYNKRREENANGALDGEIRGTLRAYKALFNQRVLAKAGEAAKSRVEARRNNINGGKQLLQAVWALGGVVAIILFLLFFKVELNLRKMIPPQS